MENFPSNQLFGEAEETREERIKDPAHLEILHRAENPMLFQISIPSQKTNATLRSRASGSPTKHRVSLSEATFYDRVKTQSRKFLFPAEPTKQFFRTQSFVKKTEPGVGAYAKNTR